VKHTLVFVALAFCVAWDAGSREPPVHQWDTSEVPEALASKASPNRRTTDRIPTAKGDLFVTPLDHASVLLGWEGKAIYVDPTPAAVEDKFLPRADVILVTESRFDHIDPIAVQRLQHPGTVVVGPAALAKRVHVDVVMENGDTREVDGFVATAVPMYSLERGPALGVLYHPRGLGNGYVIDFAGTRVYVSGDTECTPEVKALRDIDVAFVAVKSPLAMSPAEAVQCIGAFHPKIVFPYHDRYTDLTELEHALPAQGIDVRNRNFFPRAERWRRDAVTACNEGQIGICRDRLELARALDPESEKDPRVIHCREQVRAWQSPFPSWW
jgi:L-ascorbate metabolism protein UlaG (beta-lactamase superfamily)